MNGHSTSDSAGHSKVRFTELRVVPCTNLFVASSVCSVRLPVGVERPLAIPYVR